MREMEGIPPKELSCLLAHFFHQSQKTVRNFNFCHAKIGVLDNKPLFPCYSVDVLFCSIAENFYSLFVF